jgi:hypothetical protein
MRSVLLIGGLLDGQRVEVADDIRLIQVPGGPQPWQDYVVYGLLDTDEAHPFLYVATLKDDPTGAVARLIAAYERKENGNPDQ